jgi:hypothetical protein
MRKAAIAILPLTSTRDVLVRERDVALTIAVLRLLPAASKMAQRLEPIVERACADRPSWCTSWPVQRR